MNMDMRCLLRGRKKEYPRVSVWKLRKQSDILADGTDDVQLVVTVLDRDGRELSNSPDVTLSVLSGPGEFPTGRSTLFSADSDIRIADGKAAMALRAYYAGHTVVEASSSGLESGRVQLEFTGAPEYEEGKSVQVLSRPYVRFATHRVKPELQTYGPNSPTFASTSPKGILRVGLPMEIIPLIGNRKKAMRLPI